MAQGKGKISKKQGKRPTGAKIRKEISKMKKGGSVAAPKRGKKVDYHKFNKMLTAKINKNIEDSLLERAVQGGEKGLLLNKAAAKLPTPKKKGDKSKKKHK
eukprot:Rmarinus@m.8482